MALSESQIENIVILIKKGGMSNRAIAKEVGCSESAVRTWIKKTGAEKNALKDLATREIENIINGVEIKNAKNALSDAEKNAYTELLLEEAQNKNLVMNASQLLITKVIDKLNDGTKLEKVAVGNGIQQLETVGLGSSDYKNYADTIDKASVTMGVNERHAPKQNINLAQQNIGEQNNEIIGYEVTKLDEPDSSI